MSAKFHPENPYEDLTALVANTIVIVAATVVILKIHRITKNTFAYTLMVFTILIGVSWIGAVFTEAFREEVLLLWDYQIHYFYSEYTLRTFDFIYLTSSALQGWIFAVRYLTSALACSLSKTSCFTTECVMYTGWAVGIVYSVAMTALVIALLVTFPGWYDTMT